MVATFPESPQTSIRPPKHTGNAGGHRHRPAPPGWALPTDERSTGLGRADDTLCPRRVSPKTRAPPCSPWPPSTLRSPALPKPRGAARSRGRRGCQRSSSAEGSRGTDERSRWCPAAGHRSTPLPRSQPCGDTPVCGESQGQIWGNRRGLRPVPTPAAQALPCNLAAWHSSWWPSVCQGGHMVGARGRGKLGAGAKFGGKINSGAELGLWEGRATHSAGRDRAHVPPLLPRCRVTLARPSAVSRSPVRRASHPGEAVGTERRGTELLPCCSRRECRAPWR